MGRLPLKRWLIVDNKTMIVELKKILEDIDKFNDILDENNLAHKIISDRLADLAESLEQKLLEYQLL